MASDALLERSVLSTSIPGAAFACGGFRHDAQRHILLRFPIPELLSESGAAC